MVEKVQKGWLEYIVVRQDSKVLKYKIQYFSDMKDLMIIHIEIGLCTP